jgi:MFS family permease
MSSPSADNYVHSSLYELLVSLLTWTFIILLIVVSVTTLAPPAPVSATAALTDFSADRALIHVRAIAQTAHPIGTDANSAVRAYLLAQLTALGLNPQVFSSIGVYARNKTAAIGNTQDIVGRLSGTASPQAIMLVAHYDSTYRGPGAADDGAGVAAILEAVRALRAGPALKNDVIVLFTDGEEVGLLGADAFAFSHPWMKDVGLIMNFEARGNQGPSLLFETSPNNSSLIRAVAESASHPIGSSFFYALYKLLPNDTDFTVFRSLGTPGLNFAFGEGLEAYHSRLDTAENLSLASLQHQGSYALTLTRHFGQSELGHFKQRRGDNVFFDLIGSEFITYGERWILPGEIFVTLLLVLTILLHTRKSKLSVAKVLLALLPCVAILLAIPVVLGLCGWRLISSIATHRIISDSLPNAYLLVSFILIGACTGSLLLVIFRKRFSILELSLAGLICTCILSWVIALALPGGSYLLLWPLLFMTAGLLSLALAGKTLESRFSGMASLAGLVIAILLFAPLAKLLYLFLTLDLVTLVAVGLLLGLLLIICMPIMNLAVPRVGWRLVVSSLLAAALICAGAGIHLSHYSQEHPRHDTVLYSLNADDNSAVWISFDHSVDDWTAQFFPQQPPDSKPAPNYLGGSSKKVLSASATAQRLPPPQAEIETNEKSGDVYRIKMKVRSQRDASAIYLKFGTDSQPLSVRVGAREATFRPDSGPTAISLHGIGAQGIELDLTIRARSGVSFWLMDESTGLPMEARPRPSDFMADFMAGDGSDVTFVCRKYSL